MSGADTLMLSSSLPLFHPYLQNIFGGQLRHECRLYAVLVTVVSAQQTRIWNINA